MKPQATDPLPPVAEITKSGKVVDLRAQQQRSADPPQRPKDDGNARLIEQLFVLEGRIRDVENLQALKYFSVNELRGIIPASQIIIFKRRTAGKRWKVEAVSSLAAPDERSPLLQWLCTQLQTKTDAELLKGPVTYRFDLDDAPNHSAAFQYCLLGPLRSGQNINEVAIGFFSERPFPDQSKAVLSRVGASIGHAWSVFDKGKSPLFFAVPKPVKWVALMAVMIMLFIPVSLTVLAPVQIVSHQPKVIAAPISGVIKEIFVLPNQTVKAGDLLYTFDKTEANNNFEQSSRNLLVAETRYKRANQAAFGAGALKGEMAIARAEVELAAAERASYQRRLNMADVYAPANGIVLFESVEKWTGRPVETGERVMQIADPENMALKVDLATDDAILLSSNAKAKIFLDANPLNPLDARIFHTSYDAVMSERDVLVFPISARFVENEELKNEPLRIGLRGTAQLFGDKVPLWFFLFRKPLSYLRQITGL